MKKTLIFVEKGAMELGVWQNLLSCLSDVEQPTLLVPTLSNEKIKIVECDVLKEKAPVEDDYADSEIDYI